MTGNAADQSPARSSLEDIASAAAHLLERTDADLAPHAPALLRLELALGDVEREVYPLDDELGDPEREARFQAWLAAGEPTADDDLGDPEGAIAAESAPASETARQLIDYRDPLRPPRPDSPPPRLIVVAPNTAYAEDWARAESVEPGTWVLVANPAQVVKVRDQDAQYVTVVPERATRGDQMRVANLAELLRHRGKVQR